MLLSLDFVSFQLVSYLQHFSMQLDRGVHMDCDALACYYTIAEFSTHEAQVKCQEPTGIEYMMAVMRINKNRNLEVLWKEEITYLKTGSYHLL